MTERREDWNVGLAQDLQDDEFVREFVAAADPFAPSRASKSSTTSS
jgi:hypothetical protein